ncbi:MAG TPA: penicillin acylase family protein, partial [Gemmatimonadaceae bacterium]
MVLVCTLWLGARGAGPLPPLGSLLDPVHGAWAAASHATLARTASARIPGLNGAVDVRYDDRGVPHIFATTEPDAYRALGYVVARDRLFQLDLQTHAASGRLTEWAGAAALPLDRQTRDLGMPRAAEQRLAAMDTTSEAWHGLQAFSDGVNAYINSLKPADWPVEYRLLDVRPEPWRPINSLHVMNRMGWTLSYIPDEGARWAARELVGDSAAEVLFPLHAAIQEPIQPTGQTGPTYQFMRLPAPGRPDSSAREVAALLRGLLPIGVAPDADPRHFASNNWAVAPSRSADGHALLANDPHLDLRLPSIWYETQMVVPGKLDVYGVTIPGLPGVVLGFNRDVAWGFTNTGADVVDFYKETVNSAQNPTEYRLDGAWKPLAIRVEVYRGKRGEVLATDTVRYTHRGPLMRRFGNWVSMRWTVLEGSSGLQAFADASHATTAREFLDEMARGYVAPAQNMIVADRQGTIAIRSTGRFPIRPKGIDGLEMFDGSTSASDWTGYWPVDKYPQSFAPKQGYLASANQEPEDPSQQFAYLGDERAYDPWRALDINALLRRNAHVTTDDMRSFQTNPMSMRARMFVQYFTQAAVSPTGGAYGTPTIQNAARILSRWDMRYTRDNGGAALFEEAMRELRDFTWDELIGPNGRRVATPSDEVMLELLNQPESVWWDDRRTKGVVETRDAILTKALVAAYDTLTARYGEPGPDG